MTTTMETEQPVSTVRVNFAPLFKGVWRVEIDQFQLGRVLEREVAESIEIWTGLKCLSFGRNKPLTAWAKGKWDAPRGFKSICDLKEVT